MICDKNNIPHFNITSPIIFHLLYRLQRFIKEGLSEDGNAADDLALTQNNILQHLGMTRQKVSHISSHDSSLSPM